MSGFATKDVIAPLSSEERFVDRTGRGPRSWTQLKPLLAEARKGGWAVGDGEITPGVRTVAAPVRDVLGRPVAAIGVSVIEDASTDSIDGRLGTEVVEAAAQLSARLS